ncbi:hypothetical protein SIN8267_02919 [Sinobacterium norvegicum]|uniref:DUF2789 domain-containing protein n=1 Tax=Sinobacterium norvegicum TaxID=1641715 RepID=A0ABN8EP73_9GAMM|nr:DUF2789 domain-containing protein [Sinobacterium norvegicum]CAH0992782.1 hypothetical protein SIN8267_02919 [Sinobacterium norvegicum]
MDTSTHTMNNLFIQLGLSGDESDIEHFIARHVIDSSRNLAEAPFWSIAQAEFLRSAVEDDADWVGIVNQLDVRLRRGD